MYTSGTAASFAALKTAIETFLAANGWTLATDVLSRGAAFVQLTADTYAQLSAGTGQAGAALTGACALSVKLMDFSNAPITWPVDYEIHAFDDPDEVYVVVRYNLDRYQHLHFGLSAVPGIGGTGLWFGGTFRSTVVRTSAQCKIFMDSGSGIGSQIGATPYDGAGLGFWYAGSTGNYQSTFVHCGLEGAGWKTGYVGNAA